MEVIMKILIVNDDGINAPGIHKLAKLAKSFGEIWVVAPSSQCSGMSHRISIREELSIKKESSFPVDGVNAYSVGGNPADCVKFALEYLLPCKPDFVFSGINYGFNAGIDVVYSGTVAAAMEARLKGIPSIAFSSDINEVYDAVEGYLPDLISELTRNIPSDDEIWNVNFPGCSMEQCRGIMYGCRLAKTQYYIDSYEKTGGDDDAYTVCLRGTPITSAESGTDLHAVMNNYISVGKIKNMVLMDK